MQPGDNVFYLETADNTWHPGTVKFECCEHSFLGPYTLVIDEIGLGHVCHADQIAPRPTGGSYVERTPGPRKQTT